MHCDKRTLNLSFCEESACEVIKLEGNAPDEVITDALAWARSQSPSEAADHGAMIGVDEIH